MPYKLRRSDTISRKTTLSKLFCISSEKRSTQEGKNVIFFLLEYIFFFIFVYAPFSEEVYNVS